ncbi:FAD-dependent oxidoreductase, partial [Variovorax sp.]
LLLAAAATARQAGAKVLRIAEQAAFGAVAGFALGLARWPGKAMQALTLADVAYRTGSHVVEALGTTQLESVRLNQGGRLQEMACERLACGFGLVPNTQLGQMLGCALAPFGDSGTLALAVDERQATSLDGVYAAGECTGFGGSERALAQGAIAGHAAVGDDKAARLQYAERARWNAFAMRLHRSFAPGPAIRSLARPDTLVCRCEDVPLAALAGCGGWTDAKLHQRCGMGPCQGRVCGDAAQFLFGWTPPAPRPPLSLVRIATLAGLGARDPD